MFYYSLNVCKLLELNNADILNISEYNEMILTFKKWRVRKSSNRYLKFSSALRKWIVAWLSCLVDGQPIALWTQQCFKLSLNNSINFFKKVLPSLPIITWFQTCQFYNAENNQSNHLRVNNNKLNNLSKNLIRYEQITRVTIQQKSMLLS